MTPSRADKHQELSSIQDGLAVISYHLLPVKTSTDSVLRFTRDAQRSVYWDNEAVSVRAQARQLKQYAQAILRAAEEIETATGVL